MKTKLFRSFVILIIIAGGFFILGKISFAAVSDIVINEIGAYESGDHEWIEIYNKGSETVDLTGWKFYEENTNHGLTAFRGDLSIEPGEYAIIADVANNFQTDYPLFIGTIIDSSWTTLNESGEPIALKDSLGNIIESFTYINAPDHSLERADYNLSDYTSTNWQEHLSGNTAGVQNSNYGLPSGPVCGNAICESGEDSLSCPADCSIPLPAPVCGNSICESGEDELICPADCSAPPTPTEINPGDVVINEFVSDPAEGEEWIEIFSKKDSVINLTDWKLEDGVSTIATLSGTIVAGGFQTVELSSSKLNNSGDIIILKKSDGTIIDQVAYGNWDDGNITDNAIKASDPNSSARILDGADTGNDVADFSVTTTLTKNSTNTITAPPSEETSGTSTPEETTPSSPPSWPVGSLLINELVADPTDGEVEWIEFYNPGSVVINLNGWTVEDGGETVTTLSGSVGSLGFYVLEKPKGILNNSGDAIFLKDPAGLIIDQISYGDFDDGEKSDNAPAASDPNSTARKTDGQNTTDDFNDFIITTPTRGTSNAGGLQQNPNGAYSKDIIVNEVLPNPKGDDSQTEFIELKNIGTVDIDLTGWKIGDASSKRYTVKASDFPSIILKPKEFFVLYRKVMGIALNNSGTESAKIYSPDGALVHSIEYSGAAAEDESFARETENYFWTSAPTPGKENVITRKNQTPSATISAPNEGEINQTISFDGSDSADPDGDELIFSWNFGDGSEAAGANASHAYLTAGKYKIILTAKDSLGVTDTAEQYILIIDPTNTAEVFPPAEQLIFINEIIPNPEGSDDAEWIEIKSINLEPLDLSGWKLDDDEGGSRPYKIPEGTIIAPGQFLVFKKEQTKLALNNTYDAARLLDPDGEIFFETSYDEVPEGAAFAREENGNFKWTTKLTPGAENIFQFQEKAAAKKSSSSSNKKATTFTPTTLEEIRNLELNDGVRVSGQVIVPPGVLGSQIFYIVDPEACPGIQIYMYSKNFPELNLGDLVEITGVLAESSGEKRIKVSEKDNIKILENQEIPAAIPLPIKLSGIEDGLEGCLVSTAGEVTEKSGSNLYFADDDGELKIYFKSTLNFPKPKMDIGDEIETVGIVSQTKTGFRLLPRYETDIKIKTPAVEPTALEMKTESGGGKINLYLGAVTGLLGLTLVGLGIKAGTFGNWWKKIRGI
jgi:hypothetical protein